MPGERGLPGSRRGRINLRAAPLHQRNVNKAPPTTCPKDSRFAPQPQSTRGWHPRVERGSLLIFNVYRLCRIGSTHVLGPDTYNLPPMLSFVWCGIRSALPRDLRQFHKLDGLCGCLTARSICPEVVSSWQGT